MRKMRQIKKNIFVLLFGTCIILTMFNVQGITKEPEMSVTYTMKYERDSEQFAGGLVNLHNTSYFIDNEPEASTGDLETQYYRVNTSLIQVPLFNETGYNFTSVRVDSGASENISSVNQTDSFTVSRDEDAVWKLAGNMNTTRTQINATSLDMNYGNCTGNIANLALENTTGLTFTPRIDGDYRTNKFPTWLGNYMWNYVDFTGSITVADLSDTNEATYAWLDYEYNPSDPAHNSYTFETTIRTTVIEAQLNFKKIVYFYAEEADKYINTRSFLKIYMYDFPMSIISGKDTWDLMFEWNQSRSTGKWGNGAGSYDAATLIYPAVANLNNLSTPSSRLYETRVKIVNSMVKEPGSEARQRMLDKFTLCYVKQRDFVAQGEFSFANIGYDNVASPVNVRLDIHTNMVGSIYYKTGSGIWATLFTINQDNGLKATSYIYMHQTSPSIKIDLYAPVLTALNSGVLSIHFLNLTAYLFNINATMNITHDPGTGLENETIPLQLTRATFDNMCNFTFEMECSTQDFVHWTRSTDLLVPCQLLNVTFEDIYAHTNANITWNVNYSVNTYLTPSELELALNGEDVMDVAFNEGIIEFDDWPERLNFTANQESYARIGIESVITLENTLEFQTRTLVKDTWTLEQPVNLTITKIEIDGVESVSHVYLNGIDYGSVTTIALNCAIQRGATTKLSIILGAPVYKLLQNLYAINKAGTIETDVFGHFNTYHYHDQDDGLFTFNVPGDYRINESRLTFDAEQNRTYVDQFPYYMNWDFEDSSLDDWTLGKYGYHPEISEEHARGGSEAVMLDNNSQSFLWINHAAPKIIEFSTWVLINGTSAFTSFCIFLLDAGTNPPSTETVKAKIDCGGGLIHSANMGHSYPLLGSYVANVWFKVGFIDYQNGSMAYLVNDSIEDVARYEDWTYTSANSFCIENNMQNIASSPDTCWADDVVAKGIDYEGTFSTGSNLESSLTTSDEEALVYQQAKDCQVRDVRGSEGIAFARAPG